MVKALIELYVPALGKSYDVYIPLNSKMGSIKLLLSRAVKDLDNIPLNEEAILCDYKTGKEYDINEKAIDLKIENGSKMMLI